METRADRTATIPESVPTAPAGDAVPRPVRRWVKWAKRLGLAALALLILGGGGGTALVWALTRELPSFDTLKDYKPLLVTRVLGVNGEEVFEFYRERRTVVPFNDVPQVVRQAVLASEDAHFYEHGGVNYLAIMRCLAKDIIQRKKACGGSTITQQVVKTFLFSNEKVWTRKVKEIVLARRLEEHLSKDDILYLYLNQIYFGHRRFGVEEAARFYFGKGVKEVTLGEAAVLAGVVQSPERLSPTKHPEAAKDRQKYVLRRMAEEGFITAKQAEEEAARPILVASHPTDPPGAYYADEVRRYLNAKYGADKVETDGFTVEIAMDPAMQRIAEDALETDLRSIDRRQGWRGALEHLDGKQLEAVVPVWKARLQSTKVKAGEVLVWDLAKVHPDDLEPGQENKKDILAMARARPLGDGELYSALVTKVDDKQATVDLGNATGTIALAEMKWARKFSPSSGTAAPKKAGEVVTTGDIVLVKVLPGKVKAVALVREGKPLALGLEQVPKVQGAFVAIDPVTRGVRALVGGYDYFRSPLNRATQAKRQPGSAMKPFVWGAAFDSQRYTPTTVVYDTPDLYRDEITGQEWKPRNFERDEYDGPLLMKAALAHSKNTVSAKLVDQLGVDAVIDFAHRAGIESELPRYKTLALGVGEVKPIELVNAYATFAQNGVYAPPIMVVRVRDRRGEILEEHPAPEAVQAIRPEVAFVLSQTMKDVIEYGTGAGAKSLERPAGGKTGTAQDHRDAWFVGFTPELVAGAWVGFDLHEEMGPKETGAGAALPAWLPFMKKALEGKPVQDFQAPENVEFARIDPKTGLLAKEGVEAPFVAFVAGTAPTETAPEPGANDAAPQNFFKEDQ